MKPAISDSAHKSLKRRLPGASVARCNSFSKRPMLAPVCQQVTIRSHQGQENERSRRASLPAQIQGETGGFSLLWENAGPSVSTDGYQSPLFPGAKAMSCYPVTTGGRFTTPKKRGVSSVLIATPNDYCPYSGGSPTLLACSTSWLKRNRVASYSS